MYSFVPLFYFSRRVSRSCSDNTSNDWVCRNSYQRLTNPQGEGFLCDLMEAFGQMNFQKKSYLGSISVINDVPWWRARERLILICVFFSPGRNLNLTYISRVSPLKKIEKAREQEGAWQES